MKAPRWAVLISFQLRRGRAAFSGLASRSGAYTDCDYANSKSVCQLAGQQFLQRPYIMLTTLLKDIRIGDAVIVYKAGDIIPTLCGRIASARVKKPDGDSSAPVPLVNQISAL